MSDGSSLGVTPSNGVTTQLLSAYNSVFPTAGNATYIGGLSKDKTDITVLSQLDANVSQNYYTFNFEQGSNLKLAFNTTAGLSKSFGAPAAGTSSDAVSSGLRFQLYDVAGNLVADSSGTAEQQTAYANLTSSNGLSASPGGYYVKIGPATGTNIHSQTNYSFNLFSGTTYDTNLVYTAQTQAYDPNLFLPASSTVTAAISNQTTTAEATLTNYATTAYLTGVQAKALNIGTLDANQSQLDVVSKLNSVNQSSYYSFDFNSGSSLKFQTYNTTDPASAQNLRVQLSDSNGKIVADSGGTEAQQEAYKKFDSGAGLTAKNGKYTVKVSYAAGTYTTNPQTYNFQIYSGTSYNTQYKTTANLPPTTTSTDQYGQNLGVFGDLNAKLYTRPEFHKVGEDASSGPQIGWIYENKSASNVVSQLTQFDSSNYYNFTLQKGSNLKLAYNNQTSSSQTRIQLLDPTGTSIIADNHGTDAQKLAFSQLTSSTGVKAAPGSYVVNVSYAPGADKTKAQTYNFQVFSGDTYTSLYKFTVSAETYAHAKATHNPNLAPHNTATDTAAYLNSTLSGASGLFDTLSTLV